jgi:NAD-dependent oxidoreductase involved in siderophore biosynthesis
MSLVAGLPRIASTSCVSVISLMSGYSGPQLLERAHTVGVREVLRKPLQSRDIAECFGR